MEWDLRDQGGGRMTIPTAQIANGNTQQNERDSSRKQGCHD
jgi:hypothetical protein